MIKTTIQYEEKDHSLYYHDDLIHRIACENNTFFEEWLLTPLKEKIKTILRREENVIYAEKNLTAKIWLNAEIIVI